MTRIPIENAARELPYTDAYIRETLEEFNLDLQPDPTDPSGPPKTVNKTALEKILAARGPEQSPSHLETLIKKLPEDLRKVVSNTIALGFTGLAAAGAVGAAIVALVQMNKAQDALFAQNRYEAMSDVGDALDVVRNVDRTNADAVDSAFRNLDTRMEIVHGLRKDGGIRDVNWTEFLMQYCPDLDEKAYYDRPDLFEATMAMCNEERGEWQQKPEPSQPSRT